MPNKNNSVTKLANINSKTSIVNESAPKAVISVGTRLLCRNNFGNNWNMKA